MNAASTNAHSAPVEVVKLADRFSISVDGIEAALTRYADHSGSRIFYHTETRNEFSGRGLATALIRQALDQTREEDLRIVPVCPMVAAFVAEHPDYLSIVVEPTHELVEWLGAHLSSR